MGVLKSSILSCVFQRSAGSFTSGSRSPNRVWSDFSGKLKTKWGEAFDTRKGEKWIGVIITFSPTEQWSGDIKGRSRVDATLPRSEISRFHFRHVQITWGSSITTNKSSKNLIIPIIGVVKFFRRQIGRDEPLCYRLDIWSGGSNIKTEKGGCIGLPPPPLPI